MSGRRRSPVRGRGGFTLLELIITLGVIALIVGLLGGVLRLASRAWERGEQQVETRQRSRDLAAFLSQELRSVYPYQLRTDTRPVYFFEGRGDRVRFVSALPDPAPDRRAPLRVVSVFVEPGRGLLVRSAPLVGGGLPEEGRDPAQLLDGRVRELRLRYLGAEEGWVSSWEPQEVPPAGSLAVALRARRPVGSEPAPAIPRAVEVTLVLDSAAVLGPFTVPVIAGMELQKTDPAGGGAS